MFVVCCINGRNDGHDADDEAARHDACNAATWCSNATILSSIITGYLLVFSTASLTSSCLMVIVVVAADTTCTLCLEKTTLM